MKRTPLKPASPEVTRAWQQRSRKPLNRTSPKRSGSTLKRRSQSIPGFTLKAKGETLCRVCAHHGIQRPATDPHHAVPKGKTRAGRSDLRNLLPICREHHRSWHDGTPIPRSVFTAEEWAFIETLASESWLDRRYPEEGNE